MFNVGDKVVYPMHGAGTIDSIDKKNILDEEVEYINISMPGGVKVMVPSNQASKQTRSRHVRRVFYRQIAISIRFQTDYPILSAP